MSLMAWGIPVLIILMIPAFGLLMPGFISDWVKVIPSYYFVHAVDQAANFAAGWSELWQDLAILAAFGALFIWLGAVALRRRLW